MPLIKSTLQSQLDKAFADAMRKFLTVAKSGGIKDTQNQAITEAAQVFSQEASTAIDSYIKSATIIVPPGQAVIAGSPPGPGTTTAPSSPAQIS